MTNLWTGVTARQNIRGVVILMIILMTFHLLLYEEETIESAELSPFVSDSIFQIPRQFTSPLVWTEATSCLGYRERDKTLIIIVNTARSNFDRRQLIRDSWGSTKKIGGWSIMAVNFFLGQAALPNETRSISQKLENERSTFGDLILGNFTDTYRNLTLKTIMGYEWLREFCPQAQAVVKMDDDVVLNVFQLIKLLNENPHLYQNSSNYYGDTHEGSGPVRDPKHRWFVSKEDYPSDGYPRYVSGFGQLMTLQVVNKVLDELVYFEHRISMDDIFLAGIVPESYNQRLKNISQKFKGTDTPILRLHINGTWQFDANENSNSSLKLRQWYGQNGRKNDENFTWYDEAVTNPLFYIIQHGTKFETDFLSTWNKLKAQNGQID